MNLVLEAKRSRILTLDLLRGYFLFVIIVDHIGFFPSIFELITGRGEMWASAAEGFFMISGLLVGYVYGPRMVRNVWGTATKIWKRATLLYVLTILLTFVFVWWGNLSNIAYVKEGLWTHPEFGELLYKTLTMQYYYGWADFLPYYAIFMAWAPLALYACIRGKAWMVVAVSLVCWLLRGQSFEMAWQLLFMNSIAIGWYLPKIEATVRSWAPTVRRGAQRWLYGVALGMIAMSALTILLAEGAVHEWGGFATLWAPLQAVLIALDGIRLFMTPLIVKWTLEPGRIIAAIVWFAALYVWVRQHEALVGRYSFGLFRALGERSLAVYVTHAFVIFALLQLVTAEHGFVANSLLGAFIVGLIYVIVIQWSVMSGWVRHRLKAGVMRGQLRRLKSEEAA